MNLTEQQIADNVAAVAAHLRGGNVEWRSPKQEDPPWSPYVHVICGPFDFESFHYRPVQVTQPPPPPPLWSKVEHVPLGAIFDDGKIQGIITGCDHSGFFHFGHTYYRGMNTIRPEHRWRWPQSRVWYCCTVESTQKERSDFH